MAWSSITPRTDRKTHPGCSFCTAARVRRTTTAAADARARERLSADLLRSARRRDDRERGSLARSPGRRTSTISRRSCASCRSSRSRSSATRGAGCSRCSTRSRSRADFATRASSFPADSAGPGAHGAHLPGSAPPRRFARSSARSSRAASARPGSQEERAAIAASGLRERDPAAYAKRIFELGVAGYFADPARARELTPFRVIATGAAVGVGEPRGLRSHDAAAARSRRPTLVLHGAHDAIPLASSSADRDSAPARRAGGARRKRPRPLR